MVEFNFEVTSLSPMKVKIRKSNLSKPSSKKDNENIDNSVEISIGPEFHDEEDSEEKSTSVSP